MGLSLKVAILSVKRASLLLFEVVDAVGALDRWQIGLLGIELVEGVLI